MKQKWCIGIDPGLRESGAVLFLDEGEMSPVAYATWSCTGTERHDLSRVVALASEIITQILAWIEKYGIERIDVSIETPVYKRNAATFIKQIRLLQEIESGLFHIVAGEVGEFWLTEINPITSKVLSTGRGKATKDEMIAVSPFVKTKMGQHTKETVADAWSHGLGAWTAGTRVRLSNMTAAEVKHGVKYEGPNPVGPDERDGDPQV